MKRIIAGIKELYLLADADFYFCRQGGPPIWWRKSYKKKLTTTTRVAGATHNITTHTSVKNARYSICLNIASIFSKFHKRYNALICIASDKIQWHNLTRAQPKLPRVFPLVAMLKLVRLRSRTHTSWIISCLRQRFCVEIGRSTIKCEHNSLIVL